MEIIIGAIIIFAVFMTALWAAEHHEDVTDKPRHKKM